MAIFDSYKVEYIFDLLEQLSKLAIECGEEQIAASIDAVIKEYAQRHERAKALIVALRQKDEGSKLN